MSSDVFIISAAHGRSTTAAIWQATERGGVRPADVQDVLLGLDGSAEVRDAERIARDAGLSCPVACVVSSYRAIYFAAAVILSDDTDLSLVVALGDDTSTAFVLASPEAVGRMNLLPRARIAARSLARPEPALEATGLTNDDIEITKSGEQAALLLYELIEELEARPARWGMVVVGEALMLVERV